MYWIFMMFLILLMVVGLFILEAGIKLMLSDEEFFMFDISLSYDRVVFLYLVILVSLVILFYSLMYMSMNYNFGYYTVMMFIFMMSMALLLMSNNWIVLLLSWEGLGMSSFFLINFDLSWEGKNNSMETLITMRFGDYWLVYLIGSVLFYSFNNVLEYVYVDALFFVLLCITKSVQIPFTSWLPKAMSAPTPTSALVHSSTLVTAGLVLMIKHMELIMASSMMTLMTILGFITMVGGSALAMVENELKKVVAFSTLSQMGLGMMAYGLGNFNFGYFNLLAHGFAKSILFMQIGYIMHVRQSEQNIRKCGDGGNVPGFCHLQLMLTLVSICGLGFLSGMVTKESIVASVFSSYLKDLVLFLITLSLYLTCLYSLRVYLAIYGSGSSVLNFESMSVWMMFMFVLELMMVVGYMFWLIKNISFSSKLIFIPVDFMEKELFMLFMIISCYFFSFHSITHMMSMLMFYNFLMGFFLGLIGVVVNLSILNLKLDLLLLWVNRFYTSEFLSNYSKLKMSSWGAYSKSIIIIVCMFLMFI